MTSTDKPRRRPDGSIGPTAHYMALGRRHRAEMARGLLGGACTPVGGTRSRTHK